jgi:hypothetical protein
MVVFILLIDIIIIIIINYNIFMIIQLNCSSRMTFLFIYFNP